MSAPAPGSPEWLKLVTASKVAAIIGVSPWESPMSTWHRMRGELPPVEVTDAMKRGHLLESGVLAWWRSKHPEFTVCTEQYWATLPGHPWAGATPDLRAERDDEVVVVDAKTASRMDGDWGQPGTDQAPDHYLTAAYWQLAMVPEAKRAYIAVLGPFLEFSEYVVERDEEIQADLIERCRVFHESLSQDTPPPLDSHVATFETLRALNPGVAKGESVEIPTDLAAEFLAAREAEDRAIERARLADSRLIEAVGIAQYVTSDGVRVARQQANRRRPIPLTHAAALAADTEGRAA